MGTKEWFPSLHQLLGATPPKDMPSFSKRPVHAPGQALACAWDPQANKQIGYPQTQAPLPIHSFPCQSEDYTLPGVAKPWPSSKSAGHQWRLEGGRGESKDTQAQQ